MKCEKKDFSLHKVEPECNLIDSCWCTFIIFIQLNKQKRCKQSSSEAYISINYTGLQKHIILGFLQHIVNLLFYNKGHSNFLPHLTEMNLTESVLLLLNNWGEI